MKKGAPRCGLYLRIDRDMDMQAAILGLRQVAMVVNRSEYERNMHVVEVAAPAPDDQESRERASTLIELAKLGGLVAIMAGSAEAAHALNAEGVLLDDENAIGLARSVLGDAAIIGLSCGGDEGRAQRAVNLGCDYVGFERGSPDLFARWDTGHTQPALADIALDNNLAGAYAASGASLLNCSRYVWKHPKGVMQGVVNMLHAIDLALEKHGAN